ncbi:MAG: hypothetical protein E7454_02485 [Ruminococcaceae bacterium]|nr:hypothetical protein [Oscillospiraceae bacterium]
MKKLLIILCAMLMLAGCSTTTFESIDDNQDVPVMGKPATLLIDLPEDAAVPAMEGTFGKLYFCDDYDVTVEVLPAGNLDETIQVLTGFGRNELKIIETKRCGVSCYESAWSAAGEAGDQVGRVLILDDSCYHYCVTVQAPAEEASQCLAQWAELLDSVALAEG